MIHSLVDYINEKNIDNFLSNEVIISEKLSAHKLIFEKHNNELKFYKSDYTPISKIDLAINSNIEDIILDIKILCENKNIPENYYFSFYYQDDSLKNVIQYTNLNKYILSDIVKKDNLKYNISLNENLVAEWAIKLSMGLPPIIYKGYLSDEQKQLLINYSKNNYEFIKESKFTDFIIDNFCQTYSNENVIAGINIKSGDEILTISSHEFNVLNESICVNRHMNDLLVLYINAICENVLFENSDKDKDINYINFVCTFYTNFLNVHKNILKSIFETLNYDAYKNSSTKYINDNINIILAESESNKCLYFTMLDMLRHKIEYNTSILNEEDVQKYNSFIDNINTCIFEENVVVQEVSKQRELTDIDNMKVIASIQNAFNIKQKNKNKGLKKCILYVCDILTFTSSQLRNMEICAKQYNIPIILFGISHNKSLQGKKYRVSDNLLNAQLSGLKDTYGYIGDAFILSSCNLSVVFETVRPTYEPIQLICDNQQLINDFKNQLYFEEKVLGGRINIIDEFQIINVENEDKNSSLRALEDGNILLFKNISPQPIINLWDMLYNEYKIWSGKILK